jgi:hypothetical protein
MLPLKAKREKTKNASFASRGKGLKTKNKIKHSLCSDKLKAPKKKKIIKSTKLPREN